MTPRIPTKLTIKEGRYYMTLEGSKVGPAIFSSKDSEDAPWLLDGWWYTNDGKVAGFASGHRLDLISEVPAKRIAPAAKARKVLVRWCFTVGHSMYARATRALSIEERRKQIEHGNGPVGPIERHEFTLPSPKKASKP